MKLAPASLLAACVLGCVSSAAMARPAALTEGFEDVNTLSGAGWTFINRSNPLGITNWFQGSSFGSQSGTVFSYLAANFNNTGLTGDISNWAILPTMSLQNGDSISFFTRTQANPAAYADRLEVRLSQNGSSSDVGASESSVGDFSTLLLSINPTLNTTDYPGDWTQYTVTLSGLGGPISGRFAFRYFVTDSGVFGNNGAYIGIDTLEVTVAGRAVPLPTGALMAGSGLGILGVRRRRPLAG